MSLCGHCPDYPLPPLDESNFREGVTKKMEKGKILITVQPIEKKRVWKNPKKKPEFPGQKKPKFQEQMQIRDTISGDVLLLMNPGDSKVLVTRNLETPEYVNPSSTKKIIKDWMRKHRQGV